MGNLDELRQYYQGHKQEMEDFLRSCADLGRSNDAQELFRCLCRNLLASKVKWESVEKAVEYLDKKNLLFGGDAASLRDGLKGCGYRFTNRAEWLYQARQRFCDKGCEIGIVDFVHWVGVFCAKDPVEARNLLADWNKEKHISGLGMKEASHFLRDLGFSRNRLAILDSVILGQLVCFKVIEEMPGSLTKRIYLAIEDKVKKWADNIVGIPLDGLDWLLWRMGRSSAHSC